MTLKIESVVDGSVHAEEALGAASRFETLHLALSPSRRCHGLASRFLEASTTKR
jgi:hypothetical protein